MLSSFQELPPELLKPETYTCKKKLFDEKEEEKLHTKQLLKRLNEMRRNNPADCCGFCTNWVECNKIHEDNMSMIKKILATREHVLNKNESKQLRKERIKRGV